MEDQPEQFFFITFRSLEHQQWFMGTQILFWVIMLFCVIAITTRQPWLSYIHSLSLAGVHFLISCVAIEKTNWGEIVVPMFSGDCIWYNAIMGSLYTGIFILSLFYQRKKATPE